jgi:capsular exopolysaccharide synthesis family protein
MSRVDEAWRRASSLAAHSAGMAAHAQRFEEPDHAVLQHYPREARAPIVPDITPDRWPHRTILAPRTGDRHQLASPPAEFEHKLVVSERAAPIAVEQYRRIAGALHELQVDHGVKTLMVTSAAPDEGKTLTVANLALTLSGSCGRRVLLVDADLRRPQLHELFRLPNATGLSDLLRSERSEIPVLKVTEHLSILTAGQSDQPMAALTSDRMRVLLEQFSSTFDWVLFDAAPVGFMPDAHLLSRLTGAVLFVIAAQSTQHALVSRAIAGLDPQRIVGIVLNSVDVRNIPAAAYYREYYAQARPTD